MTVQDRGGTGEVAAQLVGYCGQAEYLLRVLTSLPR